MPCKKKVLSLVNKLAGTTKLPDCFQRVFFRLSYSSSLTKFTFRFPEEDVSEGWRNSNSVNQHKVSIYTNWRVFQGNNETAW